MVVQLIPSRNGKPVPAAEISPFCRFHKSKMCSFQYRQENGQLNLNSSSAVLNAPGWNLFKTLWIHRKRMAYGVQCAHTGSRMHFQMITQDNTQTQTTATSSTWLNEQCKWGSTQRARAVPDPMGELPSLQSCSLCTDPSVSIHICSSKTHTGLKLLQS